MVAFAQITQILKTRFNRAEFPRIKLYLIGACLICSNAMAEPCAKNPSDDPVLGFQVLSENDNFYSHTDQYYTNGIQVSWWKGNEGIPEGVNTLIDRVQGEASGDCDAHKTRRAIIYSFGQLMYTPQDIKIASPQPLDRPWAGWLYVGAAISDQRVKQWGSTTIGLRNTYGLDLGVTGPPSLAEQTQKFVHKIIDSPKPQGWDHQIKTEPGAILKYKIEAREIKDYPLFDLTPYTGFMLGNIMTNASIGAIARIGVFNCGFEYFQKKIGPTNVNQLASLDKVPVPPPTQCSSRTLGPLSELYVSGGIEARGVARNIFLDGNTFRDSASVDKKYFVYDISWGIYGKLGPSTGIFNGMFFGITWVRRSPEFSTPAGDAAIQRYGAINIGWEAF